MPIKGIQRNVTRNQSTVDYTIEDIFMYENRYQEAVLLNNTGAEKTFINGNLVIRKTDAPTQIIPAVEGVAGADLAFVIGILKTDDLTLANAGTAPVNYCISGDIDAGLIQFPSGVTLNTVVGATGKILKDVLTDLGFILRNVTELSKINN